MSEKLTLLYHIINSDKDSLVKEVYETQIKFKFPGLTQECIELIKELGLPNIMSENDREKISKLKWKQLIKKAIMEKCESELKSEILKLKKLKNGPMESETLKTKHYLKTNKLKDARILFKYRSKMLDFKFNYKNDVIYSKEMWSCDSCQSAIESQDHILWCPAYVDLREGKSINEDKDLIAYFAAVMKIREELKLKK